MIGIYFVHGWMHLCMVQVDYKLFSIGWCMLDALVYVDRLIFQTPLKFIYFICCQCFIHDLMYVIVLIIFLHAYGEIHLC
jgi:hypothetical protein